MTASIYGLYDSAGCLRYIGKANDPRKRLDGHMRDARRRRTPLYDWINKHGRPAMRVIEADCEDWKASERRLIAEARARGDKLLNIADGGDEPFCPPEVRSANGRRLRDLMLSGCKADGSDYTRAELIQNALDWILRDAIKHVRLSLITKVASDMLTRYYEDPETYRCWKWLADRDYDRVLPA